MPTRLISQAEIQQKKTEERRREVDEGVKLAKRVDGLRQTVAKEETINRKYRDESLKVLVGEVASVMKDLHKAVSDLKKTREKAAELRKPLDAEWANVRSHKAAMKSQEEAIQNAMANHVAREASIEAREQGLAIEVTRIQDMRETAEDMLAQARDNLERADETLKETTQKAESVIAMFNHRERTAQAREAAVSSREHDADNRAKNLDARENSLNDERRRVEDLYKTFLRNKDRG